MRASMTNTVDPLVSPEEPPAVNYAAVRSFPLFPSLTRGPSLSAAEAQAGVQRGPRRVLGRACMLCGPLFLRAGPTVAEFCFLICFVLLFHRFVLIFKNLYFLVYRSKCYGSNFVGFLVLSSI